MTPVPVGDQRAVGARRDVARATAPSRRTDVVDDAGALGVGQELRVGSRSGRGPGIRNSRRTRPLPWLTILVMVPLRVPSTWRSPRPGTPRRRRSPVLRPAPCARRRSRGTTISGLRDTCSLEALAAHHLDQDRQLQLAAAEHLELLGVSVGSTRIETLPSSSFSSRSLRWREVRYCAVAAGHRRGVDAEHHRHGRLVDGHRRQSASASRGRRWSRRS